MSGPLARSSVVAAIVAATAWTAGTVVIGAVVAPTLFRHLPAPLAGQALGPVFLRWSAVAWILAAVAAAGLFLVARLLAVRRHRVLAAAVVLYGAVVVGARGGAHQSLRAAADLAAERRQAQEAGTADAGLEARFRAAHELSVRRAKTETVVALVAALALGAAGVVLVPKAPGAEA